MKKRLGILLVLAATAQAQAENFSVFGGSSSFLGLNGGGFLGIEVPIVQTDNFGISARGSAEYNAAIWAKSNSAISADAIVKVNLLPYSKIYGGLAVGYGTDVSKTDTSSPFFGLVGGAEINISDGWGFLLEQVYRKTFAGGEHSYSTRIGLKFKF